MLSPREIQRFARQMLVRDVGREGQETLLCTVVSATGGGPALEAAIELLSAAGVYVKREAAEAAAEIAGRALGNTAFADRRAACGACLEAFFDALPAAPEAQRWATAFGVGAAVAGDVVMGLLDPTRGPVAMVFAPLALRAEAARPECACRPSQW